MAAGSAVRLSACPSLDSRSPPFRGGTRGYWEHLDRLAFEKERGRYYETRSPRQESCQLGLRRTVPPRPLGG